VGGGLDVLVGEVDVAGEAGREEEGEDGLREGGFTVGPAAIFYLVVEPGGKGVSHRLQFTCESVEWSACYQDDS